MNNSIDEVMEMEKEEVDHEGITKHIQTYAHLISTLPLESFQEVYPVRKYQGFWFLESLLPGLLAMRDHFRPRPDDLFLMSYPKSGTTWTKALMFATMTRNIMHPSAPQHPLLNRHPHDCVPFLDDIFAAGQEAKIDAMPSPRIMATHAPYSLLPASIWNASSTCRIVYVCRDPKDVLVSLSHFLLRGSSATAPSSDPLAATFEPFCDGVCPFGPPWQHVLEFWRESSRRPEKVLFLKYEEMMDDPVGNLKKLAEFIGCPFSTNEEKEGMVEGIVNLCSFKKLKALEVNKKGVGGTVARIPNSAFFRKGEVGDWKNHMTAEMADKIDRVVLSKLQGSGLALGSANRSCMDPVC